ncbi:unnamed protein product, partial [Brassica oleracea var. botrytis]
FSHKSRPLTIQTQAFFFFESATIGLPEEPHRNSTEDSISCFGLRKKSNKEKQKMTQTNAGASSGAAAATTTELPPPQPQPQTQRSEMVLHTGSLSFSSHMSREDEEMTRSALSAFRAKEDEIEKRRMEVRGRIQAQLGRVEEETRRLSTLREEIESMADPMRKEVSVVRKKIDSVNKELKPLGATVQKKEREYKEALDTFNEKNREKVQLITKLMEMEQLVGESEKLRMKKLEELSKSIEETV